MATELALPSYAKINRFLHITGLLDNGYHNLQTLMQFIDLKDTLSFKLNKTSNITVTSNISISKPEDNLVYLAADKLRPYAAKLSGLTIHIDKKIPMGAGLGGGSSNAAVTLLALNHLWQCNLDQATLLKLAKELGADVPFFIFGQCAWAEGIGEKLTAFNQDEPLILLFIPKIHISTAEIFKHPKLERNHPVISKDNYAFEKTENVFEPIVAELYPQIGNWINEASLEAPTRLTGSGACFYSVCQDLNQLQKLQKKFHKRLDTIPSKALNYAAVAYDDL
ncbi:4-(cytidine 5'-diphospho)-2-C-methyl-D-erythritol kinase [Thiotrichales bacterium 19S11-10]|nr:4-(cytidine 5'-diphospho)-2-C-methyl-D-erythritol kinase [Thiotrichales bacterium 19S11-10]